MLFYSKSLIINKYSNESQFNIAEWSSLVARRAHNPKVVGSNPAPATTKHLEVIQDAFLLSHFLYPAVSDKKSSRRSARRELLLLCGLPGHFSTAPRFALVTMRA